MLDFFQIFITPLGRELGVRGSHAGRSHGLRNQGEYFTRNQSDQLRAGTDDSQSIRAWSPRSFWSAYRVCGKTRRRRCISTCNAAFRCAQFPLTPDDFRRGALPTTSITCVICDKLFSCIA